MTAAELSALSDQQLSERVAVEVAGWEKKGAGPRVTQMGLDCTWYDLSRGPFAVEPPIFATSVDAVLPLIGMQYFTAVRNPYNEEWTAIVGASPVFQHKDKSLARALSIALLLAKGAA